MTDIQVLVAAEPAESAEPSEPAGPGARTLRPAVDDTVLRGLLRGTVFAARQDDEEQAGSGHGRRPSANCRIAMQYLD
ncbi:hypothetical protein GCM10009760_08430 [Kitasatospora kazusensis]|uniref:Uncharacterized protein n=1 Tax=Kitasatospora kazusensis TaxID=407974 RepID=A0ABP5KIF8_9ACTN